MDGKAELFLEEQSNAINQMELEVCLASWNANVTGEKKFYKAEEEAHKKFNAFFSSKEGFERVTQLISGATAETTKRQLELLRLSYLSAQTDIGLLNHSTELGNAIEEAFNTYRAEIGGRQVPDNEIKAILRDSNDSAAVEEVWKASKRQGERVVGKVLELAKVRNDIARSLGFKNYADYSLSINEQSEQEVSTLLDELEKVTREPFRKLKGEIDTQLSIKFNVPLHELKPWHYGDLFFQEGPKLEGVDLDAIYGQKDIIKIIKQFYSDIGLEAGDILERSDMFEKPGKCQHAFCTAIGREGDVRILENVMNDESWTDTTLHELGHAVYEKYVARDLPFLLRSNAHTFITEAVAMVMGRLSKNPEFIKKYAGVEVSEEDKRRLHDSQKQRQLVFARWVMTVYNFEKELYSNPDQDLNSKWWELVGKYQMLDFKRDSPDWASKIHIPCYPMYYHNYLLGEMLASQIDSSVKKEVSLEGLIHPGTGQFLKERLFSKGASMRWDKAIEQSFGEPLNPKYFVEAFV